MKEVKASQLLQRAWLRKFKYMTTIRLVQGFHFKGPTIDYVRSIR